jgi:2-polyprenyl-3-methyl-5-hydroxy-6-metoxy-1,4-benzoquinol methylase/predicted Ser/Thr protein kinase
MRTRVSTILSTAVRAAKKLIPLRLKRIYWQRGQLKKMGARGYLLRTAARRASQFLPRTLWKNRVPVADEKPMRESYWACAPRVVSFLGLRGLAVAERPIHAPIAHEIISLSLLESLRIHPEWHVSVGSITGTVTQDHYLCPAHITSFCASLCRYSQEKNGAAVCSLSFTAESDSMGVLFQTNIRYGDRWFAAAESNHAILSFFEATLGYFREALHEGMTVDRFCVGKSRSLAFLLRFPNRVQNEEEWRRFEEGVLGQGRLLSACPNSRGHGRVYLDRDCVVKVTDGVVAPGKVRTVHDEYHVLRVLEGVPGIPRPRGMGSFRGFEWIRYEYVEGTPLPDWIKVEDNGKHWARIMADLSYTVRKMNERGVVYSDWIQPGNIVVDRFGVPFIIDFDQACLADNCREELPDLSEDGRDRRRLYKPVLPDVWRTLGAGDVEERCLDRLSRAWEVAQDSDANSPGASIAYYWLDLGGRLFPGERCWYERWLPIRGAIEREFGGSKGLRVLEFGCNMGLASVYLSEAGAQCVAVDHDEKILTAGRLVAEAFGVEVDFRKCDLCDPASVSSLSGDYDVVFLLSVLHWLPQKDAVLAFLATQRMVVFEGHGSEAEDREVLEACGFVSQEVLCYTRRLRPLILAKRAESSSSRLPGATAPA